MQTSLLFSTGEAALSGNSSSASPRAEPRGGTGSREQGLHCLPGAAGLSPLNRGQECSQLQTHPPPPVGREPSRGGRLQGRPGGQGRAHPQLSPHGKAEPGLAFRRPSSRRAPSPHLLRGPGEDRQRTWRSPAHGTQEPLGAGITSTNGLTQRGN